VLRNRHDQGGCSSLCPVDTKSNVEMIAGLLHEAAETHHQVFRITDGTDEDWASWYGDWLTNLSELPTILGVAPVRSELVYALVQLDKDYTAAQPGESWESFYACRLLERFAS
jgi:hypothetical protein